MNPTPQKKKKTVKKSEKESEEEKGQSFNVFEHQLVPKHRLLPKEEAEKILAQYRVKPYQLPRLFDTDPAAKALGAKSGDILEIVRASPTAGKILYYRHVVEEV